MDRGTGTVRRVLRPRHFLEMRVVDLERFLRRSGNEASLPSLGYKLNGCTLKQHVVASWLVQVYGDP